MERKIVITGDGSHSIAIPELHVTYHSIHGAIQESEHVFIDAGLKYLPGDTIPNPFNIFEMGFGTGLNAFLTAIEAENQKIKIQYTAVEQFPITPAEAASLNYPDVLGHADLFHTIHECKWNEAVSVNEYFTLKKVETSLLNFSSSQHFNLVYYDAFAPGAQPDLWTKDIFEKIFHMLEPNGVLVTYCSKGDVRRAMIAAGFAVKKMPGPRGKREMLRATSPQPSPPEV
ncbi:MAG: tRNA (5-methylaminomethyl-2-thiouridine)(34)-methyltransferase MnmD [Flavisolibacter sp.]|nr:tRNA (5-methylaminomethyl-2-thiouridine)(34)-methyltransferase MnmD [Flavisolibacter sp.]